MDMFSTLNITANGMQAHGERIRVISENVANSSTAPQEPGAEPYVRQVITFKNELDRKMGVKLVQVDEVNKIEKDRFVLKYDPSHPGADEDGYVKMPNINSLVEMMDMREAQRTYEANMGMFEQVRDMHGRTVNLLQ